MKNSFSLFASLLFASTCLWAQPPEKIWDVFLESGSDDWLHEIISLQDGHLAAVGETLLANKNRQGLFLLIDPQNGQVLKRLTFGGQREDGFRGIAEGSDGFYLIGYTDSGPELGKQGWLVQLNFAFEEKKSRRFGSAGDDSFEKIVWFDHGSGLLAGFNGSMAEGSGHIWLSTVKNGEITACEPIGEGFVRDIISMERTRDGLAWLTGNTRKSNIPTTDRNAWAILVDETGKQHGSDTLLFADKPGKELKAAAVSTDSTLLLIGETVVHPSGQTKIWTAGADKSGSLFELPPMGEERFVFGTAILKTTDRDGIVVAQANDLGSPRILFFAEQLFNSLWAEGRNISLSKLPSFSPEKKGAFRISRLLETWQGTLIAAGNCRRKENDQQQIRLICLKNRNGIAAKWVGGPRFVRQELAEPNGDGCLSPNEDAALQLTFISDSRGDARLEISVEEPKKGFQLMSQSRYLQSMNPGEPQVIRIPVHGNADLEAGIVKLKVVVLVGGVPQPAFYPTIPCNLQKLPDATTKTPPVQLFVIEPDPTKTQKGEILAERNSQKAKIRVVSDKKLDTADFIAGKNGEEQKELKANTWEISSPYENNGRFEYTVTFTFQDLQKGRNELWFDCQGFRSDTLAVVFEEKEPNLHILAIGPAYPQTGPRDLFFPAKDAREVAAAFKRMEGNQFYNRVFVDLYNTPDSTTCTNLKKAFNDLLRRANSPDDPRHIKPNDYLVIFWSGHGDIRATDSKFCLLPADYSKADQDETYIDLRQIIDKKLNFINCKKVFLIDACLSGGAKSPTDASLNQALVEANSTAAETTVLASCSEKELSWEIESLENGAFTEALLEALSGQRIELKNGTFFQVDTDARPGVVSIGELFSFLQKRVPDLISRHREQVKQTPSMPIKGLPETLPIFILK